MFCSYYIDIHVHDVADVAAKKLEVVVLLLLSFFLYLKSVPIYVIVHVHVHAYMKVGFN